MQTICNFFSQNLCNPFPYVIGFQTAKNYQNLTTENGSEHCTLNTLKVGLGKVLLTKQRFSKINRRVR